MKLFKVNKKRKLVFLSILLVVLIVSYIILVLFNLSTVKKYDDLILPNTYIEGIDFSDYSFDASKKIMNFHQDQVLSKKIILKAADKTYEYSLKDLGVFIDQEKTLKVIKDYQKKLSYSRKLMIIHGNSPTSFSFIFAVSNDKVRSLLEGLKGQTDLDPVDGYFIVDEGVRYQAGTSGYSLNVDESFNILSKYLNGKFSEGDVVELTGDSTPANTNDTYTSIDTLTSSFVTTFMPNTYQRNINLNTALRYINGTVVAPGEVFSYCKEAGPFNKAGYVFYYEFVGNGVCQIATTTYNAALLGGLEIVKRYPHAKKSLYVQGGLDATVASYPSGWCVDMQFKNTYEYPIYIKAYSEGGRAHVEFWSNSQAKKGLEYTTSSVQIGARGYRSYLHTWKDGQEIDVHEIATTWYPEA